MMKLSSSRTKSRNSYANESAHPFVEGKSLKRRADVQALNRTENKYDLNTFATGFASSVETAHDDPTIRSKLAVVYFFNPGLDDIQKRKEIPKRLKLESDSTRI